MSADLSFEVRGTPAPQGSHRAFVNRRTGRAIVTDDSPSTRPWRQDVRAAALDATAAAGWPPPTARPVVVVLAFRFDRPKGHFGRHGLLRSAPSEKLTKPDLDKLVRSTLDALSGLVWRDDSQVVGIDASKGWADDDHPAGATIDVWLR